MTRTYKYIGIGQESVYGTEVAASDYIPVLSATPKTTKTFMPHETIGASYLPKAGLVSKNVTLDFEHYITTEDGLGKLLKWLLGDPTSAQQGATAAYLHTYLSDDSLFHFSALAGSADLAEEPYCGMIMRQIELGSEVGKYLSARTSTYGKTKGADNSIGSPTFSTLAALRHADLTVTIDSSDKSQYFSKAGVSISNNPREGAFTAGDVELQNMPKHTRRRVDVSLEMSDYDAALRTAFHANSEIDLNLKWEGATIADTYKYKLEIDISKLNLENYDQPLNSRDIETHAFKGFATYDSTDTSEIVVKLQNTETDQ